MDPFAVLGLDPGSSPQEAAAAYRRLAKRWHPDRAGVDAARRMAEINAAYDLLRAGDWQRRREDDHAHARQHGGRTHATARRGLAGAWLSPAIRRALGGELLRALEPDEAVALVTPAATWASPQTLLALTDRRLLWLLDDAPTDRVRAVRLGLVVAVEHRLRRPLRRVATVRLHLRDRRRLEFTELRPATAATLARRLSATLDLA